VIRDYQSAKLDLTKPETFRDLTKPVGALNPQRLEYFQKRMASMHDMPGGEQFLYGTHYSAPGYVLYYLVRSMPEHMLCLQNGKFDSADRMFHSVTQCFQCVMTNHADVKELLPEFYHAAAPEGGAGSGATATNFDFLLNTRGLQLGATQNGDRVDDVLLPPWARSARDFLRKNRKALESPLCTASLTSWIDLVFGCLSRGEAALQADNLFHASAYLSPVDLDSKSEEERAQLELHATEFGIVPDQLFSGLHPARGGSTSTGQDFGFVADIGRASSDDPSSAGVGAGGGAWELLDHPPLVSDPGISPTTLDVPSIEERQQDGVVEKNGLTSNAPALVSELDPPGPSIKVPLQGKGEATSERSPHSMRGFSAVLSSPAGTVRNDNAPSSSIINPIPSPSPPRIQDSPPSEWEMKILERKHVHSDAVSGCALLLSEDRSQPSILATTSLDGGLKIHKIGLGGSGDESSDRKGFPSTLSRFTYSTIMSRGGVGSTAASASNSSASSMPGSEKLSEYRSHTSRDPLACLVLAAVAGEAGLVAFVGGHDDVVLAYGIHSACAVASIYSHRDAVTGLDLIARQPPASFFLRQQQAANSFSSSGPPSALWLEKSTHVMVSGSWDATVKLWSATISTGEAVSIHREPLAELFDADSSIVCVTATPMCLDADDSSSSRLDGSIAIAAGCADGSFCVWNVHGDGVQVVVHKEPARRGSGPCSVVKWARNNEGRTYLFAAFSTGIVASYALIDGTIQRTCAVSIGIATLSLVHADGHLWVGTADGALRMIPIRDGGYFEKPTLWNAVINKSSPGITSISVTTMPSRDVSDSNPSAGNIFVCCTGGEDGSVALFQLHKQLT
jgi:Beige/BEACH domain